MSNASIRGTDISHLSPSPGLPRNNRDTLVVITKHGSFQVTWYIKCVGRIAFTGANDITMMWDEGVEMAATWWARYKIFHTTESFQASESSLSQPRNIRRRVRNRDKLAHQDLWWIWELFFKNLLKMRQRIENWPTNYAVASDEFGEVKRSKTRDYVTPYNGHLFVYGHTNTYDIQPRGGMDSHRRVYEELA